MIYLHPRAYLKLNWYLRHTENEVGFIGKLADTDRLQVDDLYLVKQEVSHASVDWNNDAVADLVLDSDCEPWQLSVFFHTHPAGCTKPSSTDNRMMDDTLGELPLRIMIILSKCETWYARVDTSVKLPGLTVKSGYEDTIEVDWSLLEGNEVSVELVNTWEKDYKELCSEGLVYTWKDIKKGVKSLGTKSLGTYWEWEESEEPTLLPEAKTTEEYLDDCNDKGLDTWNIEANWIELYGKSCPSLAEEELIQYLADSYSEEIV